MAEKDRSKGHLDTADGRREYWLQQYAAAFAGGDKRTAAMALQFARQYTPVVLQVEPKKKQQG